MYSKKNSIRETVSYIKTFYKKHGRKFPWRNTIDPYAILVSEVMLQQTQTSRVIPKYNSFIQKFPTVSLLASADQAHMFSWSGVVLGITDEERRSINHQKRLSLNTMV